MAFELPHSGTHSRCYAMMMMSKPSPLLLAMPALALLLLAAAAEAKGSPAAISPDGVSGQAPAAPLHVGMELNFGLVFTTIVALVLAYLFKTGRKPKDGSHGGSIAGPRGSARSKIDTSAMAKIAEDLQASGQMWKDPDFGHDGYGASIGAVELREGERGKKLEVGEGGVTWQSPGNFCTTKRPMTKRASDQVPTWLYSDESGDGAACAVEAMSADDIAQGSVGDCYFLASLAAVVQHHPTIAEDLIDETYEEQVRALPLLCLPGPGASATYFAATPCSAGSISRPVRLRVARGSTA